MHACLSTFYRAFYARACVDSAHTHTHTHSHSHTHTHTCLRSKYMIMYFSLGMSSIFLSMMRSAATIKGGFRLCAQRPYIVCTLQHTQKCTALSLSLSLSHTHTHTHAHTCTHAHACMQTCIQTSMHTRAHTNRIHHCEPQAALRLAQQARAAAHVFLRLTAHRCVFFVCVGMGFCGWTGTRLVLINVVAT